MIKNMNGNTCAVLHERARNYQQIFTSLPLIWHVGLRTFT